MSRRFKNRVFLTLCWSSLGFSAFVLMFLIATILWNGFQAISLEFLIQPDKKVLVLRAVFYIKLQAVLCWSLRLHCCRFP